MRYHGRSDIVPRSRDRVILVRILWMQRAVVWAAVVVAGLGSAATTAATTATPPYLTLLFGRTQIVTARDCVRMPNTVALDTGVAPALAHRGLKGTGSLVVAYTGETTRKCLDDKRADGTVVTPRAVISSSWVDAAKLRDAYGWTFVSHSRHYLDMTALSPTQQAAESCGSLSAFRSHSHYRADGLFAYPNDNYTSAIESDVVSTCFDFGRTYAGTPNDRGQMQPPWFQKTWSLNGGRCNEPSLPCSALSTRFRYASPVALGNLVASLKPDQWFVLQAYRFVTGSQANQWNCTASNWREHWTTSTEEYCWSDYLSVLNRINAATVIKDPKGVAKAWGRTL